MFSKARECITYYFQYNNIVKVTVFGNKLALSKAEKEQTVMSFSGSQAL